jgi:hypothetical protein
MFSSDQVFVESICPPEQFLVSGFNEGERYGSVGGWTVERIDCRDFLNNNPESAKSPKRFTDQLLFTNLIRVFSRNWDRRRA